MLTSEQINKVAFHNAQIAKILSKSNDVGKPKKRETAKQRQDRIQAKINQKLGN